MEEPLVLSESQQELVDLLVTIFVEQIFQNDGERAGMNLDFDKKVDHY